MGQTPQSNTALVNNAAKDDVVGLNGDFNFTISDLLANDPGGAAKVNIGTQFFFGDNAPASGIPTIASQVAYLLEHGITANVVDGKFVSFDIGVGATDINYFVQMGNKGTWSEAHVDVTAPVPVPHTGPALFTENFDGYDSSVQQTYFDGGKAVFASVDLNAAHGWVSTGSDATKSELGADGYGGITATSPAPDGTGGFWLDTQNSPGQIDISHQFTDNTAAVGGKTADLSFDIAKQSLDYQGVHYETAANASFDVKVDGVVVKHITAAELTAANQMNHISVDLAGYAGAGPDHTIELVDTSPNAGFTGFAVDSIQINDWIL